jgi:CubicO group peptidase (beta-lactamase class C family)
MGRRLCLALLPVLACAVDRFEPVRVSIRKQLRDTGVASLSVAVAHKGKIVWEEGFGWADRERRMAATPHTMYSLASISKPITATGLMTLVQDGKIGLDRPINDYLGNGKIQGGAGEASGATVRRVANHSSGLPLHYQFFYADEPYRKPSMDETILRYGNLVTPPGERHVYSNLGYGIIGHILARASGMSYPDFMRERVFVPLGLTRTSVDIGAGLEEFQAIRYGSDGLPIPFYDFDHPAASAVYSSAHDLVRFGMFHLKDHLDDQRAILSDASIDDMQKPTITIDATAGYGVGWRSQKMPDGHTLVSHSGGMGGVSTVLRLIPSEDVAVVVLTNGEQRGLMRVSDEIISLVIPGWKEAGAAPQATRVPMPKDWQGSWTGEIRTYNEKLPFELKILATGDVHARIGNQLIALVNDARIENGLLAGRFVADIRTEDANRRPYTLNLAVAMRNGKLQGGVTAMSTPGKRVGNALTYWTELSRGR